MQIRENRRNVAEPRFLCDNSSKSILNTLKASQIWNGCASQERVAEIKSGANYCCSYGFWSLNSKRSTNVTEGANMEITSLACFGHLLIKGHCWVKVNTQILNNACVQSVLKFVTEARKMKDANLKSLTTEGTYDGEMNVKCPWRKESAVSLLLHRWLAIIVHTYADLSFTDPFDFFLKLYRTVDHLFVYLIIIA